MEWRLAENLARCNGCEIRTRLCTSKRDFFPGWIQLDIRAYPHFIWTRGWYTKKCSSYIDVSKVAVMKRGEYSSLQAYRSTSVFFLFAKYNTHAQVHTYTCKLITLRTCTQNTPLNAYIRETGQATTRTWWSTWDEYRCPSFSIHVSNWISFVTFMHVFLFY